MNNQIYRWACVVCLTATIATSTAAIFFVQLAGISSVLSALTSLFLYLESNSRLPPVG
jgi:hypothetical protein